MHSDLNFVSIPEPLFEFSGQLGFHIDATLHDLLPHHLLDAVTTTLLQIYNSLLELLKPLAHSLSVLRLERLQILKLAFDLLAFNTDHLPKRNVDMPLTFLFDLVSDTFVH